MRAGRACLPLDLRRALRRSISISTCPSAAPARMAANSFGAPLARQRSWWARTSTSTRFRRRCSSNTAKQSASRSMTLITRVLRLNAAAARSMSRSPSTQRRVLGAVSCAVGSSSPAPSPGRHRGASSPPGRLFRRECRAGRRLETAAQHAQRQTRAIDRQGQMQMQAERLRGRLVAPDDAQPLAVRARRKVQVRPVLDAQHRVLAAHPLQRARPVGRENVLGRDRRRHRLVDEPVVALHRRAVVGRVGGDRLAGQRRQQPRALDQTRRQPLIAQRRPSKLVHRPGTPLSRPSAGASAGAAVDPRHPQPPPPVRLASSYRYTDFTVTGTRHGRGRRRPRPGGGPDAHEVRRPEARSRRARGATKVSTSHGRYR